MYHLKTLTLVCFLFAYIANAQNPEQNLSQGSTESTEASKKAYFPVNMYAGHAGVQVPVFDMQANGINVPVNLDYDAGGVLVNQQPSWVGQNWKLNGGGAIVRSVKGSPDEEGFFFNSSYQNNRNAYFTVVLYGELLTEQNTDSEAELKQFAIDRFNLNLKTSDTEPDIFSFSLPDGRSGKFFLGIDTTWKVISDHNFRVVFDLVDTANYINPPFHEVPGSAGNFIYEKTIEGFKIIDDMGYQFTFGFDAEAIEYNLPFFSQTSDIIFPNWTANAWYITEIKDYLGNVIFTFEYERDHFIGNLSHGPVYKNFQCKLPNDSWVDPGNSNSDEYIGSLISPVYLTNISNITGQSIGFSRSNVAEIDTSFNIDEIESQYDDVVAKVCPSGCTTTLPLPFLQESGYYSFDPSGALIDPFKGLKRKKLDQIFVNQNNILLFGVKLKYTNETDKRLQLDSVMIMDNTFPFNSAAMSHCYAFEYDDMAALPGYLSHAVDHFGYFRGQDYSFSPPLGILSNTQWDSIGTAHFNSRNADIDFAKKGSLSKIFYPHGGRSELEYELHEYSKVLSDDRQSLNSESGSIGGLRIKEIRDFTDQVSSIATITKKYKYVNNYHLGGTISSGILALKPKYHWVDWFSPTSQHPSGGYREDIFSVNNMLPISNLFETHISYPEVTEILNDSFYNVYKYTSHLQIKDELPYTALTYNQFSPYLTYGDRSFMRGKLMEVNNFNKNNFPVKKQLLYYHFSDAPSTEYSISSNAGFTLSCADPISDDKVFKGSAIKIFHHKFMIDSSRSIQYFDGDSISHSVVNNYLMPSFYGNTYIFPSAATTFNSDGKNYSTITSYPFQSGIAISGQQSFFDNLVADHRMGTVIANFKLVGITFVDGQRTLFGSFNSKTLPATMQRYEVTWDESQTLASAWVDHRTFSEYNTTFIVPIEFEEKGYQSTSISLNAQGRQTSTQYLDHSSSMAYTTGDLLQQSTDIDATYSTFTYDAFSRMKETVLMPRNTVSRYSYHYAENSTDKSYIKNTIKFSLASGSGLDSVPTISYIDGLARTEQSLDIGGGSDPSQDVVMPVTYDFYDRLDKQYLPISAMSNDGAYYAYNDAEPNTKFRYEANALNRLTSQTMPSWFPTTITYGINTMSDAVTGYNPLSLYKQITTDADGNKDISFTDKMGRLILSRKEKGADKKDTYFFYDDKDRCIKILPPSTTSSDLELIFIKRYDANDNLIYIKKPDAAPEEYLYNDKDLLAAQRNGVLESQDQWLVFLYDNYGRLIQKGIYNNTSPPSNLENPTMDVILEELYYDGFDGSSTLSESIYKGRLRKSKTRVLTVDNADSWEEILYKYDSAGRVNITTKTNFLGDTESSSFTYDGADNILSMSRHISGSNALTDHRRFTYDHRGRLIEEIANPDSLGAQILANHVYNYRNELIKKNLGKYGSNYLQSLDFTYDNRMWLNGINDLVTDLIVEDGDPCVGILDPESSSSSSTMSADGDLFAQKLYYNSGPDVSMTTVKNGQLAGQAWYHANTGRYNQTYSYAYDHINRVTNARHGEIKESNYSTKNNLSEDFDYDDRGNILKLNRRGMVQKPWVNTSCFEPLTIDSLTYEYAEGSNRLIKVVDKAPCADTVQLGNLIDRDMIFGAGDILINVSEVSDGTELHLFPQHEVNVLQSLAIHGNALAYVHQDTCPNTRFTEGFNQQSEEGTYLYDDAGNMIYDPNKKLTFAYNYLNLPYRVVGAHGDTLFMIYDAGGALLQRKYVRDSSVLDKTDYLGGIEIRNDADVVIYHDNGKIRKEDDIWKYNYNLKDHLGNVRVVFEDANTDGIIIPTEVKARYDYFAFGMQQQGFGLGYLGSDDKERYGYNGKELVEEMDMDLLLYGARQMDGAIGRWLGIDPLASDYGSSSPYAYALNNPISFTDPDGMRVDSSYIVNTKTNEVTVVDDRGGNEVDYIYFWNGHTLGDTRAQMDLFVKRVEPIYTNDRFAPSQSRFPGYIVYNNRIPMNDAVSTYDDPFTGGFSKATVGVGAALFALLRNKSKGNLWKVGSYAELRGLELGLGAHHVGQKALMKNFVTDYNLTTAPSILVPEVGHTIRGLNGIVSRSASGISNARQLLARDIFELRRVYGSQGIPNSSLQQLIQLNKTIYPSAFKR